MQKALVAAIVVSMASFAVFGQSNQVVQATVSGVVLDASRSPLGGALVCAIPAASASVAGNVLWTKSDQDGRFSILLNRGRYSIRAKLEAQGYPDPVFLFSSDSRNVFPEISLDGTTVSGVQVTLAPKGGILEGDVIDQITRRPLEGAAITVRDARHPEAFVQLKADKLGHFRLAVPNKPVTISARAPGYDARNFQNDEAITLSQGKLRSIVIELSPVSR